MIQNDQVGLIRIMPNTPVAIGQGVISLARSQAVTDQQVAKVNQLLSGAGALYEIEENWWILQRLSQAVGQPLSIRWLKPWQMQE